MKRRRLRLLGRRPYWRDFERFLWTKVHWNERHGIYEGGMLVGYLFDHPVFGLNARPERWCKLKRYVLTPHGEDASEVVKNATLLPMYLPTNFGSHKTKVLKFMRLWKPGGPLGVKIEWIREDEDFNRWWNEQHS